MNTLDYISLALGGGLSLAAVVYALYTSHSLAVQIASQATTIVVQGGRLADSERNALSYQQQRDTEKTARTKAEAELADVRAQLVSTQAALAKAGEESATNAAALVKNAPDPLRALDDVLSSSARPNVPDASHAGAGGGGQRPADV